MMDIDRERLFHERKPTFTEAQAHEFWSQNGEIVSVSGHRTALDLFIVKFACENCEIGHADAESSCCKTARISFGPSLTPRSPSHLISAASKIGIGVAARMAISLTNQA